MRPPKIQVARFFQLVLERNFAEAERTLQEIEGKIKGSEWGRGYLNALSGMLVAHRAKDDRYAFLNNFKGNGERLKRLTEEFHAKSNDLIHADMDRGYFAAWFDLLDFIDKSRVLSKKGEGEKKGLEPTMDAFLQEGVEGGETNQPLSDIAQIRT